MERRWGVSEVDFSCFLNIRSLWLGSDSLSLILSLYSFPLSHHFHHYLASLADRSEELKDCNLDMHHGCVEGDAFSGLLVWVDPIMESAELR